MQRFSVRAAATLAAVVTAFSCGDEGGVTNPDDGEAIAGLGLAASISLVSGNEGVGVFLVSAQVLVTNTSDATLTHSYPAGCPVRLRLYETGPGGALAYDESAQSCNVTSVTSFTLEPGQSRVLASTPRFPWNVSGDSLAPGLFNASAVLRITGETPIELDAGTYRLPFCEVVGPPGGFQVTQCS